MKLLKSFGKLKKRKPLLVRQIAGNSMAPTLRAGQLVIATGWFGYVRPGDVIIVSHHGLEKIKRVSDVDSQKGVYVLGDNSTQSTDSRIFGWLDPDEVIGRVVWPRISKTPRK